MVLWFLTNPGDTGYALFEYCFINHRQWFLVWGCVIAARCVILDTLDPSTEAAEAGDNDASGTVVDAAPLAVLQLRQTLFHELDAQGPQERPEDGRN